MKKRVLAILTLAGWCGFYAQAASNLITKLPDDSVRVPLLQNTRPEATTENDQGIVDDSTVLENMQLLLSRSPQQEADLDAFLESVNDAASPSYHQWLTAAQFGKLYGPSDADIAAITNWLQSKGFTVNTVLAGRTALDFSGTAGLVKAAFQTEMHNLSVDGELHVANMSDPTIPAALGDAVLGIASLNDFRPRTSLKLKPSYTFSAGGSIYEAVVPSDLATIYNFNPLYAKGISGQGQTIVLIEDTFLYTRADWDVFRKTFGLATAFKSASLTQVAPAPPSGPNNCGAPGVNGDDVEAILDVEWASAAAPNAAMVVAACADTKTTFGGLIALQNLISQTNPPSIISISYGESETYNGHAANRAYKNTYQQAAAEGVSIFVSSGDEGAASSDANKKFAKHGITVSGFASTPYNVAVGGTDFGDTVLGVNANYWSVTNNANFGSALSYIPEIPWNDSCASQLLTQFVGFSTPYGTDGFCNNIAGTNLSSLLTTASGSGGPSNCATGKPATRGVADGTCRGYAKPSWQSVFGVPNDGVRDLPDVSLFAANGIFGHYYVFCYTDLPNGGSPCVGAPLNWSGAGGTSISSPIMAGIQALINQSTKSAWGNPNPIYYKLARKEYGTTGKASCDSTIGNLTSPSCTFYDITLGDNDVVCTGTIDCYAPSGKYGILSTKSNKPRPAYPSQYGWDFATGIGSVNAYNLVTNWPKP